MKKLIAIVLLLVMTLSLASCSILPESLKASIEDIKNNILGTDDTENPDENPDDDPGEDLPPEHVHEFVSVQYVVANCENDGFEKMKCECGETQTVTYPARGHDWDTTVEASRFTHCKRLGCKDTTILADGNGKYSEQLKFTFGDEDKAALDAKHNELSDILSSAAAYDPDLHFYAEEGELADDYARVEAIYEEYSDLIFAAQGQYSIAMTLYYVDNENKELEQTYNDMMEYYNSLVAKFYSLSQPWYDSMYREFFFYGATEEEINAFLFDSNAVANPEYTALKDRNDAIELEFYNVENPFTDDLVPQLYAEMVENNNKIANLLGYDNYLEYAYENVYGRDYTYGDVSDFVEYVRTYIAPLYNAYYVKWESISGYDQAIIDEYYGVVRYSFFENELGNKLFNDYIDDMNMAFTSNPDKQISFSDNLNSLMTDGNLFRGTYEGAYVTYIYSGDIPIAYFGDGYDSSTTIAHEFGHFMNEIYNRSEYDQSYDLLETHSQGQEMLYVSYIDGKVSGTGYDLIETFQLLNTLSAVISSVQVDCFEQAVYLNEYEGPNSDIIMADGKITADEYDLLYASISEYLGIDEMYRQDDYWRYGMTITSPCYYISYAISAINCLQLYAKIHTDSFDVAKDCYLKLFTYTDVDPEMTDEDVLIYAGLTPYTEESLYSYLNEFYLAR